MELRKLACPRCRGTMFEIYLVKAEPFYFEKTILNVGEVSFLKYRCLNCGWESPPKDEEELKQLIMDMLKGKPFREGLIFADEFQ
jgi:predicted nucleic-acid-binding Zn-ribbon protein